jgi:hypothetical protein
MLRLLSEGTTFLTYSLLFETCLRLLSEGTTFPTYSLLLETCLRLLSEGTTFPTYSLLFETCLRLLMPPSHSRQRPRRMQYVLEVLINVAETCLNLKINLAFQLVFTRFTTFVVGYYYVLDQGLSTCITFSLRPQYDHTIRTTTLVLSCHVKVEFH